MEKLNELMHNRKNDVINKLSKIVHHSYAESFAKILHYAWQEGHQEAETIVDQLDLYPIDFVAVMENEEEFKELYRLEMEEYMVNYG